MTTSIAILGAGPYGLSVGAHLRSRGIHFRIFGKPMQSWIAHMPSGMALKSEGFASDLSDPEGFTLARYCAEHDLPYGDFGFPIPLQTFARYGAAFQQRLVPQVDPKTVERVDLAPGGFALRLEGGVVMRAKCVVVAVGLTYFRSLPDCLAALPTDAVSHGGEHSDLSRFRGLRVAVIGGGASATDIAALLHEHGADVTLIARAPELAWLEHALPRPWWERWLNPHTGLGFGWLHAAYITAPGLFRYFPGRSRLRITRTALGPSGASHVRDRVIGRVRLLLEHSLRSAAMRNGRVALAVVGPDGAERVEIADHVIAATGYEVDVARMSVLSEDLRARLRLIGKAPKLSASFESSVPGLYFTGATAAFTFGPLMRFVVGTGFAAPRIARHLERAAVRRASERPIGTESIAGAR